MTDLTDATEAADPADLLPEREQLRYIAQQAADARLNVELETEGMTLNMGPQHPATHGTLRIVAKLDGEQVVAAEPVAGYMHRGYEKLTEVRTYPQVTTLVNRIDWVGSFANEVPFILAAEELMGIEAPPRAQFIRTALFEMSRIANMVLFAGDMALQVGGATASFYAFRDREFVLNQIESATGGRFHPNFDRIGGLKDDLPKGWIDDTKAAMQKVRDFCDEMDRLVTGNEIFETRTRGIGVIPAHVAQSYGLSGANLRASGVDWDLRRDGGYAGLVLRPAGLEGHHPPRRRLLRPLLGARAGDPRGLQHRRPVPRQAAVGPGHGQGAPHHQGARGRGLRRDREPPRRHGLLRRLQGRPRPVPGQDPHAELQQHLHRAVAARGVYVPDIVTILASLYFILGDIDR